MASTTPLDKALVDYHDNRPVGLFTRYLLDGFEDPRARRSPTRNVTFRSLFSFAGDLTEQATGGSQKPYIFDEGGLADEILFRQTTTPRVQLPVRTGAPRKSLYHKIFVICSALHDRRFATVDSLYRYLSDRQPREFLTPIKTGRNTISYVFVSQSSFERYISVCRQLGIVQDSSLKLTQRGKQMVRGNGAAYNKVLYDAVTEQWLRFGVRIPDLEEIVAGLISRSVVPSRENIFLDMFLGTPSGRGVTIGKDRFNILLDLTAYTGALKLSQDRAYFLAVGESRRRV